MSCSNCGHNNPGDTKRPACWLIIQAGEAKYKKALKECSGPHWNAGTGTGTFEYNNWHPAMR